MGGVCMVYDTYTTLLLIMIKFEIVNELRGLSIKKRKKEKKEKREKM